MLLLEVCDNLFCTFFTFELLIRHSATQMCLLECFWCGTESRSIRCAFVAELPRIFSVRVEEKLFT